MRAAAAGRVVGRGSRAALAGTMLTAAVCSASVSLAHDGTDEESHGARDCSTQLGDIVHVEQGDVRGALTGSTYSFEGIPYAAPPVGELRWRPPAAVPAWSGVRDALAFSNACPQISSGAVIGNENCLALNVWAPAQSPASGRPVMVWIHQGGNHQGASFMSPAIDGQYWAESEGVVFVSIGYRLGAFGFLAHPALDAENRRNVSGNYGLLDQIAALRWVQRNIAAFGGDPQQVTVLGQSAGADDICVLLTSPLAKHLFARAIMESSYSGCGAPSLATQEQTTGATLVSKLACEGTPDVAACLRALPAETIVSALPGQLDLEPRIYSPNVDGFVVPDVPLSLLATTNNASARELIIGSNSAETATRVGTPIPDQATYAERIHARYGQELGDEVLGVYPAADFASPQDAFIAATTDQIHTCPARRIARVVAQHGRVHRYFFTHAVENDATLHAQGAFHTLELDFLFRTFSVFP
ncbi:MAG TPA: carboxylesterase family protein, partial [Polyangiaceae bacterium]|nr:carboxylesterase family protein [Polyangiaceae bacterium]